MLRAVGFGFLGLTAAGGAAATYKHNSDEGFRRTIQLWRVAGPTVAHYRLVEAKYKLMPPKTPEERAAADAHWAELDELYAPKILVLLQELKGMYTKYGQIAAGMTQMFSKTYIDRLRTLEDGVPPQPVHVVHQTILEDMNGTSISFFSKSSSLCYWPSFLPF